MSNVAVGVELAQAEPSLRPPESFLKATAREIFIRNPMGATGAIILSVLVIGGLGAPLIAPHDPLEQIRGHRFEGPSSSFFLGTDALSRDLLSRILYGLRASLLVSIFAVGLGSAIGVSAGFVAGYVGGLTDSIIMRLVDTMMAFPGLILAIGLLAVFGVGLQSVALALGIGAWPGFARLARGQMLAERPRDYVTAAHAMGASGKRIIFRHIAINAMPPLVVQVALAMATAVLAEAALGFLGIGTVAPHPSLGSLINDAGARLDLPHLLIAPTAALGLFLLSLNLLADAINDAMDPHRRRR